MGGPSTLKTSGRYNQNSGFEFILAVGRFPSRRLSQTVRATPPFGLETIFRGLGLFVLGEALLNSTIAIFLLLRAGGRSFHMETGAQKPVVIQVREPFGQARLKSKE